jgi:hypothetical protein
VDQTGVGYAVVDMLADGLRPPSNGLQRPIVEIGAKKLTTSA